MTKTFDWQAVQASTALVDQLPGTLAPYALSSGEGLNHDLGDWHVTTMARHADTGDEFALHRIWLPGGSTSPRLSSQGHTFLYVLEGELVVELDGRRQRVVAGDSVSVPRDVVFAVQGRAVINSFYWYSTTDWLTQVIDRAGLSTASHIFARSPQRTISELLADELTQDLGVRVQPGTSQDGPLEEAAVLDQLPDGAVAFVNKAGGGERYETYEQMNVYPVRSRNNDGAFFAMETRGAKAPYIPLHFHQQHSENFLCLGGRVRLHANGQEIVLAPGDFLHAPAGTIHSFSLAANNTHMLGLLTPPVFEPFFEYMNDPTGAFVQREGGEPYFPAEGFARARAELDLVVVGPPPGTD